MATVGSEFKEQSIFRLCENTPRIAKCLELLTEEEVWSKPNNVLNSIGNLILHLCGNIRQYAISALSGNDDTRERSKEFTTAGGYTKAALLQKLSATVDEAVQIIANADESMLIRRYSVQGFDLSGVGIIIHVTEHYSYHTGQIAFITKLLKEKDLGFYAGQDLEVKNKPL